MNRHAAHEAPETSSPASFPLPEGRVSPPLIAIDGPVGVGKSVMAARLARALGWKPLDTGAMYRAVALAALRAGADLDDEGQLAGVAAGAAIGFREQDGAARVELNGEDVTEALRGAEVDAAVPRVARHAKVRAAMIARQRRLAAEWPT
ncbi:MAG: (d)CMP kinase, partial [Candidatus Sumerlaeota bacterium]|nr:(d)CMP kinase [Candidatus Sumerlaeota bacterium]